MNKKFTNVVQNTFKNALPTIQALKKESELVLQNEYLMLGINPKSMNNKNEASVFV